MVPGFSHAGTSGQGAGRPILAATTFTRPFRALRPVPPPQTSTHCLRDQRLPRFASPRFEKCRLALARLARALSLGNRRTTRGPCFRPYRAGTSESIQDKVAGIQTERDCYLNTTDSRGPVILLKTRDASERPPPNDVVYCRAKPPARRTSNNARAIASDAAARMILRGPPGRHGHSATPSFRRRGIRHYRRHRVAHFADRLSCLVRIVR